MAGSISTFVVDAELLEGAETEGGSVGSFGAPPDGCARSTLDVTNSDRNAKTIDRGGRLCWRMGKTSGITRAQVSSMLRKGYACHLAGRNESEKGRERLSEGTAG
jgi:hypothetical protein